jgi:hypothetical protein
MYPTNIGGKPSFAGFRIAVHGDRVFRMFFRRLASGFAA